MTPIDRTIGTGNGKAIGHIANGETPDQIRERWKAGELTGACPDLIKRELEWKHKP